MKIKVDLHTHTSVTPHAYSSLMENIDVALERGLEVIAMTNHGPSTTDSPYVEWHFGNLKDIPRRVKGMVVFTGVECSFMDIEGTLDLPERLLKKMDIVIASKHGDCFACDETNHTQVLIKAMENPYIDILGHIARTSYTLKDEEYGIIAKKAKEKGKLIELNEHCFAKKNETYALNSRKLMLACKKYGTPIVVNSDSHFCTHVGKFTGALKLLEEIDFNEELVMNTSLEKFMGYITKYKNIDMLRGE